ncbi:unnamed protein product [Schistocephalus solidus]|uniref:Uncharacterized protein n=1 Tax=Schistocephalus solidus TaxID=70667 RepID=A0A3P7CEH6_SCHSO|nr:unnamed protein product [Schistocephalus solidus]
MITTSSMPRRPRSTTLSSLLHLLRRSRRRTPLASLPPPLTTCHLLHPTPPPPVLIAIAHSPATSSWSVTCEFIAQSPAKQCQEHQHTAIAAAQVYYHLKLIHVQVSVPAPPFCGT